MSFTVRPAFTLNLNQIIVGTIRFGKYDGIHACLTAATTTDKILLHNPHKKLNSTNTRLSWTETNYDIATLNFNQEIRAIQTGSLVLNDPKEILVIGSSSQLLAYHVDNNRDIFHKEIQEGINAIALGPYGPTDKPLVVVGGNQYIRGYNVDGDEVLWIVTSGKVNAIVLFDINNDGKNEESNVVCGCDDGTIKVFKNEAQLFEITENTNVVQITQIGKTNLLAYSLSDGTLGVYNENVRLWRIKSKTRGTTMTCFDLLGTGTNQLITGWESGKVDVRDFLTGENLFKLNFNQVIVSVSHADYRGVGIDDLILCTKNGEVKGYEKSKVNLNAIKPVDQDLIKSLMATKKNLLLELSHYLANSKLNKDNLEDEDARINVPDNFGVIPANTRLQIAISTNTENISNPHVEIGISTNNETVIKAVIIFSEGIFESETLIGYAYNKPTSRIIMPFRIPKDISYDIHIKVLVGYEKGQQFHVFELTRQLPKFSMYALCENEEKTSKLFQDPKNLDPLISYVAFKLNERFQRICLWVNQNFLLPSDIEPIGEEGNEELRLPLISLYDSSEVTLWFYNKNCIKIMTNNMELAGNLIQSLAKFLNIDNLMSTAHFPDVTKDIAQLFDRINGFQSTYTQLTLDITQKKNMAKNLILRAEDARLYNEDALIAIFNDIYKLNEDLISTYTIRQQNFIEMQKSLDSVNSILKSATRLRVGKEAAKMMQLLKEAVKAKNVTTITKIIESGEN